MVEHMLYALFVRAVSPGELSVGMGHSVVHKVAGPLPEAVSRASLVLHLEHDGVVHACLEEDCHEGEADGHWHPHLGRAASAGQQGRLYGREQAVVESWLHFLVAPSLASNLNLAEK